jgi:FkbM family methyltransferase
LYTSLALEFCKEVHAFEPIPKFFDVLKNNFKSYKSVFLNNLAVSDRKGKARICLGPTTIVEEMKKKYPKSCEEVEIETITLDEYIKTHSTPTIIKMDIEGAEILAIKGGYEFFKNNSPIILMEVLGDEFLEISKKAVDLLVELNYVPHQINLEGEITKVPLDFIYKLKGVNNLVFMKKKI